VAPLFGVGSATTGLAAAGSAAGAGAGALAAAGAGALAAAALGAPPDEGYFCSSFSKRVAGSFSYLWRSKVTRVSLY